MAKITGPLLSLGASGSLAKTLVYSKWKGRLYTRRHVIPANPQSTAQTLTRDIFSAMSSYWKGAGSLYRGSFDLAATGQVKTGRNIMVGQGVSLMRGETDNALFPFGPGAKGGLAPLSLVATPGSQQLSIAFTNPAVPTGWTLTSAIAACVLDGVPETPTEFTITEDEDLAGTTCVLTGLTASVLYTFGGWLKWAKPDGTVAYGPAVNGTSTPTA